jgi:hypothetical protein
LGKQDTDIVTQYVDSPTTGYAQFVAEIQSEGAAYAGKIAVQVNKRELIGGYCRFGGTASEERACARYRSVWEASQVGGARAVDPSREPVDGGWLNPEAVFETGADARKLYGRIVDHLGRVDLGKLHFVVVGEWGPTPYAKHFFKQRHPDGKAVSQAKVEVRRIAAKLAAFLDLVTEGQGSKVRADGDAPHQIDPALIVTRKVA